MYESWWNYCISARTRKQFSDWWSAKTTIFFSPTTTINLRNWTFYSSYTDALVSKICMNWNWLRPIDLCEICSYWRTWEINKWWTLNKYYVRNGMTTAASEKKKNDATRKSGINHRNGIFVWLCVLCSNDVCLSIQISHKMRVDSGERSKISLRCLRWKEENREKSHEILLLVRINQLYY